jgi:sugar transferase (PEP-CTERM/EpsH1 system associated)
MSPLVTDAFQDPIGAGNGTPKALRVVHLVSTLNIGGLEKVVYDLARLADADRVEVRVLCLGEFGALAQDFRDKGIRVESLGVLGKGTIRAVPALARWLRQVRPEVLHTHNPAPHLIGALAAKWAGVPVVVHTKHGRNYPGEFRKVWSNRIASWFTDRLVAVSEDAATVSTDIEHVPADKVSVILNGIDLDQFAPVSNAAATTLRAIHVGRLIYPAKDQKTLLRSVRLVVDEVPDFALDLVGDGPHRDMMETLCRELDLQANVRFLGFRSDVHQLLSQSHLFVLSSQQEGLSITLLEAAATGLPIVATRVGGNPEVVADGQTGLLVPPEDPAAMAQAILQLIREPELARQMGRAGRQRVEERFDLRKVVARYEDLYFELLARKRRQPLAVESTSP